jgi:hypothetical protein
LRKRTRTRQGLNGGRDNNDDRSGSVSWNRVVSNGHRQDTSDLLGSAGPITGDNSSFVPTHHGHNDAGMSDVAVPNDFRLKSLNSTDNGTQGLGDTLPHNFAYSDLETYEMSDVARTDFDSLTHSDNRDPNTWDNSTFNIDSENSSDSLRTSAENLDFSNTAKVKENPFQKTCIRVWLCVLLIALTTKPWTPLTNEIRAMRGLHAQKLALNAYLQEALLLHPQRLVYQEGKLLGVQLRCLSEQPQE